MEVTDYRVKQGDCFASIAAAHGHQWKTLWDMQENADLRAARGNPNVLLPGDIVMIPALVLREEAGATGARHRFMIKDVPGLLRIRLFERGEPIESPPFSLRIDAESIPGKIVDGVVEFPIPPRCFDAELHVGEPPNERVYRLAIGSLDPIDTVTGQKARLNNLGFFAGPVDERDTPDFRAALNGFQRSVKETETGVADACTIEKLLEKYGA